MIENRSNLLGGIRGWKGKRRRLDVNSNARLKLRNHNIICHIHTPADVCVSPRNRSGYNKLVLECIVELTEHFLFPRVSHPLRQQTNVINKELLVVSPLCRFFDELSKGAAHPNINNLRFIRRHNHDGWNPATRRLYEAAHVRRKARRIGPDHRVGKSSAVPVPMFGKIRAMRTPIAVVHKNTISGHGNRSARIIGCEHDSAVLRICDTTTPVYRHRTQGMQPLLYLT